jgi:ATP-dependent RNA helicase SUPV3L1/SUV3
LGNLVALDRAQLSGPARGIAYQLVEALGTVARGPALDAAGRLTRADRAALRQCGVRIGFATLYLPALLKPTSVRLRAILWAVWSGAATRTPPAPGITSIKKVPDTPAEFYEAVGYPVVAGRAVRADILERIDGALRHAARKGEAMPSAQVMSLAGLNAEDAARLVAGIRKRPPRRSQRRDGAASGGAFAKLRQLGLT